jgi:hypothetical protein
MDVEALVARHRKVRSRREEDCHIRDAEARTYEPVTQLE